MIPDSAAEVEERQACLTDPGIVATVLGLTGLPSCPPPLAPTGRASDPELDFGLQPGDDISCGCDKDHLVDT